MELMTTRQHHAVTIFLAYRAFFCLLTESAKKDKKQTLFTRRARLDQSAAFVADVMVIQKRPYVLDGIIQTRHMYNRFVQTETLLDRVRDNDNNRVIR